MYAFVDFTTIIEELNPRYIDAWNNVAFAYNCVGQHEEALRCATRALELKPRLAEPHRIRAYALLKMGRFRDAVTDCTRAIELYGEVNVCVCLCLCQRILTLPICRKNTTPRRTTRAGLR